LGCFPVDKTGRPVREGSVEPDGRCRFLVNPDKVSTAIEAQCIQVHDAANATERETLAMSLAGDVFAPMRQ
jgi:hypothetical protein